MICIKSSRSTNKNKLEGARRSKQKYRSLFCDFVIQTLFSQSLFWSDACDMKQAGDSHLVYKLLLLLQWLTAVQVWSSVRLMPQLNQPSSRGLLPSPTAWSPDQHHAAMLADVSRHILGRTAGCGLGFGQFVHIHTGRYLKCPSLQMGTQTTVPGAQVEDSGLLGPLQSPNWVKMCLVFFIPVSIEPGVEKCLCPNWFAATKNLNSHVASVTGLPVTMQDMFSAVLANFMFLSLLCFCCSHVSGFSRQHILFSLVLTVPIPSFLRHAEALMFSARQNSVVTVLNNFPPCILS